MRNTSNSREQKMPAGNCEDKKVVSHFRALAHRNQEKLIKLQLFFLAFFFEIQSDKSQVPVRSSKGTHFAEVKFTQMSNLVCWQFCGVAISSRTGFCPAEKNFIQKWLNSQFPKTIDLPTLGDSTELDLLFTVTGQTWHVNASRRL